MSEIINKFRCLIYSHDWQFEENLGAEGNIYKCQKCGKKDKV